MSQPDKPEDVTDDRREPYEAPRLEVEELYEVLALACGKLTGNNGNFNCRRLHRSS